MLANTVTIGAVIYQ